MNTFSRRAFGGMLLAPAMGPLISRVAGQSCAPPPGGTPVAFTPIPGLANIKRKPVSGLTATETTRLRLAYQRLRDLTTSDPSDPRGWMQQANVHCWQCGGSPSGADIHQSWSFLPWHRAYLYFHERILCKLLADNSFRLPYWDWDATISRNLPAIYRPATVSGAANSLFNSTRSAAASGGSSMPANIFPVNANPMNAANFAAFGGSSGSGGGLENGPHGAIHVWAGGPSGDMGRLDRAARDPVFFAHHCNIDRLWAEWVRRNPIGHANPTASAFLSKAFLFFDENKKWTRIKVSQVLDSVPLGSSYVPGAALAKPGHPTWIELGYDSGSGLVTLPEEDKAALMATGALVRRRSLVVEDSVMPDKTGLFNIYAGDPPAAGGDQSTAPNYLGYMGVIIGEHAHERKTTLVLNATSDFLQRAGGAGTVITIAEAGSSQGTKLSFSHVYITEE